MRKAFVALTGLLLATNMGGCSWDWPNPWEATVRTVGVIMSWLPWSL